MGRLVRLREDTASEGRAPTSIMTMISQLWYAAGHRPSQQSPMCSHMGNATARSKSKGKAQNKSAFVPALETNASDMRNIRPKPGFRIYTGFRVPINLDCLWPVSFFFRRAGRGNGQRPRRVHGRCRGGGEASTDAALMIQG